MINQSLIETNYLPNPPFMLDLATGEDRFEDDERPYRFKYCAAFLSQADEGCQNPGVRLRVLPLLKPIEPDQQLVFGVKRDFQIEALLPRQVFQKFGLAQPAWF